ncbi:FxsB family cyclophane-forming radical SAM/SPASM peptide maturase [Streptomyces hyaluromycini]|uniref:FxsB family cyclophane-forming radical SAM/SPASM peptide maturase n=1 Tax=Streptomyces hyaluromycini TaxID=1377993 RepID=UPI000B5C721C|nr:FxsB family cyclophane-forming radical SAM/SPASM peptide maturase [Streptomyces hyaluromycini]
MAGPVIPLRQLVLKVHSRCDLACRHCYVYEHADQSWMSRPRVIAEETVSRTAQRLAEHAEAHGLASVQVILHGGEPLLAGPARLRLVCEQLRTALHGVSELDLRIHTNGLQLTERYLDLFAEYHVRVGISLDGDRAANDRYRLYRDGRSSHDKVLAAIGRLRQDRYRHLFAGLLCTVDVRNDPVAAYDALARLQPPRIDFLLPHATWDAPPLRPEGSDTPYADWLLAVHDRWTEQGCPMPVRLFDSVISTLGGGPARTESLGLESADVVVIETDGSYEQADSLKTAYDGAPVTGKDVVHHTFDEVSRHPGMVARQHGIDALSAQCRECPVVRSCGGGLFAHRYRGDGSGFDNPSVFCADLKQLIESLGARTGVDVGRAVDGFDTLADGSDDGTAVRALAEVRQGVTLGLLKELNAEPARPAGELWEAAWQLALDLQMRDEALLASFLSHPFTRPWAVRCLDDTASPDHLASLVAAVALPVGAVDTVEVPVAAGFVSLPGAGRLRVDTVDRTAALTPDALRGIRWEPVRRLRFGRFDVALDDIDPHRDCLGVPVHSRLTDDEVTPWHQVLCQAIELIAERLPGVAAQMAAGLRVLTPLAAPADPAATSAGGFAALGLHLPEAPDPARVATDLVRGFRLGILDVLLDECELYDEADTRTGALLADTYARAATDAVDTMGRPADRTRAQWRRLAGATSLTALGRRFVDGIGRSL